MTKIPELHAFNDETKHNMSQEFIDEVAKQVKYGKEELYAAIQLLCVNICEHSWAFRFQQVERLDPSLVNFGITHYYTYGSSPHVESHLNYYPDGSGHDIESHLQNAQDYHYFDFMTWFYFLKGIVFEYNNKLFMKITKEYNQKKYYFGDRITIDEFYDTLIKHRKNLSEDMIAFYNELRENDKKREELGELNGFVRNPFIRTWSVPVTNDIVVIDTPSLTDCSTNEIYTEDGERRLIKVYNGHIIF